MDERAVRLDLSRAARRALVMLRATDDASARPKRRTPSHDPAFDALFLALRSVRAAIETLASDDTVQSLYGRVAAERLTLSFLYTYVSRLPSLRFSGAVFDECWQQYWAELLDPYWTHYAIAHLYSSQGTVERIELPDGVTIERRDKPRLDQMLGWSAWELDRFSEDWSNGQPGGTHLLIVRDTKQKSPENLVEVGNPEAGPIARRVLSALRLAGPGDVRLGRMFRVRPSVLRLVGGMQSETLWISPPFGTGDYAIDPIDPTRLRDLYDQLKRVEAQTGEGARRYEVALRSFTSMYERYGGQVEYQLVDAITAMEALLGSRQETTFKVSFRAASILGASEPEKARLLTRLKQYYDTRSTIVHGGVRKAKHARDLQDIEQLQRWTRMLLVAFLNLIESSRSRLANSPDEGALDEVLIDCDERLRLRELIGLP